MTEQELVERASGGFIVGCTVDGPLEGVMGTSQIARGLLCPSEGSPAPRIRGHQPEITREQVRCLRTPPHRVKSLDGGELRFERQRPVFERRCDFPRRILRSPHPCQRRGERGARVGVVRRDGERLS